MTATVFEDAVVTEIDSSPELADVEYPCKHCSKEAGPYGGRGPKPKVCADCRPKNSNRGSSRTKPSGNVHNLAAQAAGVLVQLNGLVSIGLMAVGMRETASAMGSCSDIFEKQAYDALLTDPDLCKLILRGGVQSARMSLGLAYVGMGTIVVPTAIQEYKVKREARKAEMENLEL